MIQTIKSICRSLSLGLTITVTAALLLISCSRDIPSDPMCRVKASLKELPPAPAACLIKLNGKLLALKNNNSENWHLPADKLQKKTNAQCTAHQAVWKTTGLNVEVGKLLLIDNHNTHYFSCQTNSLFSRELTYLPVPPWSLNRVSQINLVNPFETEDQEWADEIDLIKLRKAFTQTN
jgi:hypothetical protein